MYRKILKVILASFISLLLVLCEVIPIQAAAIDVGAAAVDRNSTWGVGFTGFDGTNPANGSGTVDAIEVWANTNITGLIVGTFFFVSGVTYKCRDSETISGTITAGSKQTFTGLSVAVVNGDYFGNYFTGGILEAASGQPSGSSYYQIGSYINPGSQTLYTAYTKIFSLYGTGTTSGGAAPYIPKIWWH